MFPFHGYFFKNDNFKNFSWKRIFGNFYNNYVCLLFRACEALCQCLPDQLKDDTFAECLKDDKSAKHWLTHLFKNLENMNSNGGGGGGSQQSGQTVNPLGPNKNLAGVKLPGGL